MKIQQAWNERDWRIIRVLETDELFKQHKYKIDKFIKNNTINKIEKINIKYTKLKDFYIKEDKEVLIVELHANMRDYLVDAKTLQVLEK